jgi:hypothetical protein
MAEMALMSGKAIDDYKPPPARWRTRPASRLINTMLYISDRSDGGKLPTEEVDMAGVVRNACELFQPWPRTRE